MSYSNRSGSYDYFDSLQPQKENPTPRITELLRNFLRGVHEHRKGESTSTSSKFSSDYQRRIGEKLVVLSKEIGKDNDGTVIYEGYYEDRPVAVKRLLRSHHIVVDREIKHLIKSDQCHNIVRYHGMEFDRDFYYLAVERCDCSLDDLIQIYSAGSLGQYELVINDFHCITRLYKEDRLEKLKHILGNVKLWEANKARPSPLLLKLMRDVVSGLVVHALNIIHRDLKPKSILIIKEISTLCAKLSDIGISRSLSGNKSKLSNHNTGCAATSRKPGEQLLCGRQTRAMDMFSLGCILFFALLSASIHLENMMNVMGILRSTIRRTCF